MTQLENRSKRWLDFQGMQSNVKTMLLVSGPFDTPRPWPYPENRQARIDWACDAYASMRERVAWLDDDALPCLMPYTGTELIAQAFGCRVHYSGDNMPFALPRIRSAAELPAVQKPDVHTSTLEEIFEIARALRRRCGTDALLQLPDIQSPLDIAALIWEKQDFLISMLDEPEAVRDIIALTEAFLIEFLEAWFAEFGTEYIAHFPSYFMRGGLTLSEDEAGEISPELFDEFCLPSLNRLSRHFGGIGIHCCADAKHQWPGFARVEGLKLLNLGPKPGVLPDAYRFFADRVAQMHSWNGDGAPNASWARLFPPQAHIVLSYYAPTRAEAIEACARLREIEALRA